MAECPELSKFQYIYLLYFSETETAQLLGTCLSTSFYSALKFVYNEIVLSDTPQKKTEFSFQL